ncbi:uncharacterized protein LOC123910431 [Trifolium pratense]|uniref:uncharacterized protein LOC123910431 n=1 Tax=Trifolium pratense TaxID=57577 RepID=UPI001E696A7A|nr:uncharacterized protein LOC123910431 [Trifolium pratense]
MGKIGDEYVQQEEQRENNDGEEDLRRCSVVLRLFSFKCLFILFFSLSAFLSGIFWILPKHTTVISFDAKDIIKNSATVQASFRLENPVSQLIPYIERLEYDIFGEIALPNTKVAILSIHQSVAPNWSDVVFGVLSDPMNVPINPVHLSVLKSSLIELFLQQSNLTFTTPVIGNTSLFEILKFPGGLTVIPEQSASIWQIREILFNFTLHNSISEVLDKFDDFEEELRFGLQLKTDENVYVEITNAHGSTVASPVVVQASVMRGFESLMPQRLKQIAQTIRGSARKNLGLNNVVFGKVKEIRLSSFLKDTLHVYPPAPAPSPQLTDHSEPSVSPYHSPSYSPISPVTAETPCFDCEVSSPSPSIVTEHPPAYSPVASPTSYTASHTAGVPPDLSRRVPEVSHGFKLRRDEERSNKMVSHLLAPSSPSSAGGGDLRR